MNNTYIYIEVDLCQKYDDKNKFDYTVAYLNTKSNKCFLVSILSF